MASVRLVQILSLRPAWAMLDLFENTCNEKYLLNYWLRFLHKRKLITVRKGSRKERKAVLLESVRGGTAVCE